MNTEDLSIYVFQNDVQKLKEFFSANPDFSPDTTFSLKTPALQNQYLDGGEKFPMNGLKLTHIAAAGDALETFQLLLNNGFSINNITTSNYLPIHYACISGSYNIVCYILHEDPNIVQKSLEKGEYNIFYLTVRNNDLRIMELLFQHIDINLIRNLQKNPIKKAIYTKNIDCLKFLLNHGLEYQEEYTLPMLATMMAYSGDIVEYLIDYEKRPLNYLTPTRHKTLLGLLCFYGKFYKKTILNVLKKMDEIEPPIPNISGPVHWMCQICDIDIIKEFMRFNIDLNRLDEKQRSGFNILSYNCKMPENLILEIAKLLINAGFDVNIKSTPSALEDFTFSLKRFYSVIKFLIDSGADIYVLNKHGKRLYDEVMSKSDRKLKNIFELK